MQEGVPPDGVVIAGSIATSASRRSLRAAGQMYAGGVCNHVCHSRHTAVPQHSAPWLEGRAADCPPNADKAVTLESVHGPARDLHGCRGCGGIWT